MHVLYERSEFLFYRTEMDPILAITNLKQIQHLIHLVARAYYDAREIIVLDVLLHNDYVQDGQLASAVGIQPKELQKICGRLKAHGMLKIESRLEEIPYPKVCKTDSADP